MANPLLFRLVLNPLHLPLWPQPLVPVVRQEAGTLACPGLGNFQDPNNCARYFSCGELGSQAKIVNCNPGTLYNPALGVCDWAANVDCSDTGSSSPPSEGPSTSPILVEVEPEFECQTEGVFPDPEDCTRYFACNIKAGNSALASQFVAYGIDCPPGLAYTETEDGWQGCTWPPAGGCQGLQEPDWAEEQAAIAAPISPPAAPAAPATPATTPRPWTGGVEVVGDRLADKDLEDTIIDAKF